MLIEDLDLVDLELRNEFHCSSQLVSLPFSNLRIFLAG